MDDKIVIGIHGPIGSGKDTLAQMLSVQLQNKGYSCERIGFADALKQEIAYMLLHYEHEAFDCLDGKETHEAILEKVKWINENKQHFRLILQGWGTDFRRQMCGEHYWVNKWRSIVSYSQSKIIFAPDVRFQNEYDIIKSMHGHLIWIDRANVKRDSHSSEASLAYNHFHIIANHDSLLALESQARRFISINGL